MISNHLFYVSEFVAMYCVYKLNTPQSHHIY